MARELALTARTIDGAEAERVGLVTRCYPTAAAMAEAVAQTARQMAAKSPLAITGTKRILLHCRCGDSVESTNTYRITVCDISPLPTIYSIVESQYGAGIK